mmetsp:Transcript_16696/g.34871  ORF Transcript_16696/g.34871 Transcript_16696/m.34871 type:complete len:437 (+) Transcript_16696:11-1321(+)
MIIFITGQVRSTTMTTPNSRDDFSFQPHDFRPRYSPDETSEAAYEKDLQNRRFQNRRRRAIQLLLLVIAVLGAEVAARVYIFFAGTEGGVLTMREQKNDYQINEMEEGSRRGGLVRLWTHLRMKGKQPSKEAFNTAKLDSLGYFDGISHDDWLSLKQETKNAMSLQQSLMAESSEMISEGGANIDSNSWWMKNWRTNFTCKNKMRVGGKWICDPRRIISLQDEYQHSVSAGNQNIGDVGNKCIIYISGGSEFEFANQFLDYAMVRMLEIHNEQEVRGHGVKRMKQEQKSYETCEVHVFNPTGMEPPQPREGMVVHPWGFRPTDKASMGSGTDNAATPTFKTILDTITELGHLDKTISILALDCEGCEWDIYCDILDLNASFQQILFQLHGTPSIANEFFTSMQNAGHVIYDREMDPGGAGDVYNYSFLKLAASFFD